MKKEFDCVKFMRKQRNKLSKEYLKEPKRFLNSLAKKFSKINKNFNNSTQVNLVNPGL